MDKWSILKIFWIKNMEPLTSIHTAMAHEESPRVDISPLRASRGLGWLQMSSATALMALIVLGSFTRVVVAFAAPTESPVQHESTAS